MWILVMYFPLQSRKKLPQGVIPDDLGSLSACFGANVLMKLLGNYCRNADIRTSITVGIVGLPNVGKSSIINSLKRSRACSVGATPGVTKWVTWVSRDCHVILWLSLCLFFVGVDLICPEVTYVRTYVHQCNQYSGTLYVHHVHCTKIACTDTPFLQFLHLLRCICMHLHLH